MTITKIYKKDLKNNEYNNNKFNDLFILSYLNIILKDKKQLIIKNIVKIIYNKTNKTLEITYYIKGTNGQNNIIYLDLKKIKTIKHNYIDQPI